MAECVSNDCQNEPQYRMFWPGNPPSHVCEPCRERALGIASAMGFHLHTEPLPLKDPEESPS